MPNGRLTREESREEFEAIKAGLRELVRNTKDRGPTDAAEAAFRAFEGRRERLQVAQDEERDRTGRAPEVFSSEFDDLARLEGIIEARVKGFVSPEEGVAGRAIRQFFFGPRDEVIEGGVITGILKAIRAARHAPKILRYVAGGTKTARPVGEAIVISRAEAARFGMSGYVIEGAGAPGARIHTYTVAGVRLLEGDQVVANVHTGAHNPAVLGRMFADLERKFAGDGLRLMNVSVVQRSSIRGGNRFNHFLMQPGRRPFGPPVDVLVLAKDFDFVVGMGATGGWIVLGGALWDLDPQATAFLDLEDPLRDGTQLIQIGPPTFNGEPVEWIEVGWVEEEVAPVTRLVPVVEPESARARLIRETREARTREARTQGVRTTGIP